MLPGDGPLSPLGFPGVARLDGVPIYSDAAIMVLVGPWLVPILMSILGAVLRSRTFVLSGAVATGILALLTSVALYTMRGTTIAGGLDFLLTGVVSFLGGATTALALHEMLRSHKIGSR